MEEFQPDGSLAARRERLGLNKIVPVRLPSEKWELMKMEAREMGIGPTTLARIWILEELRKLNAEDGGKIG